MTELAYPLQWPQGRPRTPGAERSTGFVELRKSRELIQREMVHEIELMGGTDIVVSTNVPIRRDGLPYANAGEPADPGIAVYFYRGKARVCFACDRYQRLWMNMRAITKTINAMRGIERWGSKEMLDQAFTGFAALPPPSVIEMPSGAVMVWRKVLGVSDTAAWSEIRSAYREKMREASDEEKSALNQAYELAKKEFEE